MLLTAICVKRFQFHHISGCYVLLDIMTVAVRGPPRLCQVFHTFAVTGRSALQITSFGHRSVVKQTFIRYQQTKTQPSRKPNQTGSEPSAEQSNVVDPDVTLYHRPKQHAFSINLGQPKSSIEGADEAALTGTDVRTDASLNCSNSDSFSATEKMKDTLRAILRQQTAAEQDKDVAKVRSIDELMCREVKPGMDMSQLPGIYGRLSKLRLTGM
jgi:hypothetical protein